LEFLTPGYAQPFRIQKSEATPLIGMHQDCRNAARKRRFDNPIGAFGNKLALP